AYGHPLAGMPPGQGAARTPAHAGAEARRHAREGVAVGHTGFAGNLESLGGAVPAKPPHRTTPPHQR
ncbi:hypothetical protein, partial [Calidithermus terrae]|uniref:hypothetical protein n=1 Tax=Calidithermus terrae TaxID=1408545 RepID=UPI001C3FB4E1